MENIKHEILNETYRPWVKKLGQWHLADDNGKTRCGVPMLGNNYAKYIPENERTKCDKCFEQITRNRANKSGPSGRFFIKLYFIAYKVLLIPCGNGAAFKQL